jgi:hypothetical protein
MANRMTFDREERTISPACRPEDFSIKLEGLTEKGDHCVVVCKKLLPNVFLIKNGLLFIDENKSLAKPEPLSVTCPTKIFLIPE